MGSYAKLYSFQDSSLMEYDVVIRFIFLWMLGEANFNGIFDGSPQSMARRANVPEKDMRRALDMFQAPDPESKSKLEEGRRLIYQGENKWWLVNFVEYRTREGDGKDYQQMQWRKRKARQAAGEDWDEAEWYREDALRQGTSQEAHGKFTGIHDYKDKDKDKEVVDIHSVSKSNNRFIPPTEREVGEWLTGKLLPEYAVSEAENFIGFYESKNWMIGKNKMSKWPTALGRWVATSVKEGKAKYTPEEKTRIIKTRLAKRSQLEGKNE